MLADADTDAVVDADELHYRLEVRVHHGRFSLEVNFFQVGLLLDQLQKKGQDGLARQRVIVETKGLQILSFPISFRLGVKGT